MRPRILVGIPCFGDVPNEVYEDHARFFYYLGRRYPEYDFYLAIKTKSEQFRARNAIIRAALGVGARYTLMIDDDMVFEYNETFNLECGEVDSYEFLRKMIAHDKEIVGAVYVTRGGAYEPVILMKEGPSYRKIGWDEIEDGLMPVDSIGGGLMLINNNIFRKGGIELPVFEPELEWGTDIQLCRKAQEIGIQPYVDTTIHVGHLSRRREIVTTKNYRDFIEDTMLRRSREFTPIVRETLDVDDLVHFEKL